MCISPRSARLRMAALLAAAGLALSLLAVPAGAAAPATAAIAGLVTGDGGRPLAGAVVEIYRYGNGWIGQTETGAAGEFQFAPAAAAGVYWLRAWAPGHAVAELSWVPGRSAPAHLALTPLYGGLAGTVTGTAGRPLAGAQVTLYRPAAGIIAQAETDADGGFRLQQVPTGGGYQLQVLAPGWMPYTAPAPEIGGGSVAQTVIALSPALGEVTGRLSAPAGTAVAGLPVAVVRANGTVAAAGETDAAGRFALSFALAAGTPESFRVLAGAGAVLQTDAAPFTLDAAGRVDLSGAAEVRVSPLTATLVGSVATPDGEPAANVELWLEQQGVGIIATGRTDAAGQFRFSGLTTGAAPVRVRALPDRNAWHSAATPWAPLQAGHTRSVALSLTRGSDADYGNGAIRGLVADPEGRPVAGATVELIREGVGVAATATTGADGSYRFSAVAANYLVPVPNRFGQTVTVQPDNGYLVRVGQSGFHPAAAAEVIHVEKNRELAVDITLAPLTRPVTGRVLDTAGNPVAGALVELVTDRPPGRLTTLTDATGRFRVESPAPGRYWVRASKEGYTAGLPASPDAWPLHLSPAASAAVDLVLQPNTGTLAGLVVNDRGLPLTGATVTIWDGSRETSVAVGAGGRLEQPVPAGLPLTLTVSAPGHQAGIHPVVVSVAPGERSQFALALAPAAGSVAGLLVGADGAPLAGAAVELLQEGKGVVARATTSSTGVYTFEQVPAGADARYLVRAILPGHGYRVAGQSAPPALFSVRPGQMEWIHLEAVPLR